MQSNANQSAGTTLDDIKLKAKADLLFALFSQAREELVRQKSSFEHELQRCDARLSQLEHELQRRSDELVNQRSTFEDELQRRDGRLSQLEHELQRRDDKLRRRDDELQRRDDELRRRDDELQNLKRVIAEIMGSTSWRLTAPLRALARAIRGSR